LDGLAVEGDGLPVECGEVGERVTVAVVLTSADGRQTIKEFLGVTWRNVTMA
jgi:hypothetical protein